MIERLREAKERRDAEKLQKKLIRADDESVVKALPSDAENFGIDFPKVVGSMDDPKKQYEVVKNNMPEIIGNNEVRNTLKHLEAPYVAKVVEKTEEELQEEGKIKNAIMAIKDNGVKLDLTQQYLEFLTKWDVVDIFGTLSPVKETKKSKKKAEENAEEKPKEESEEKAEENAEEKPKGESEQKVEEKNPIEEKKIEIISQIILNDFKKSGASWNIKELTDFLEERSKLSVLNITLTNIAGLMNERKQKYLQIKDVSHRETAARILGDLSRQKSKIVADLLKEVHMEPADKRKVLEEYKNQKGNLLTEDEMKMVEEYLPEIREKKKKPAHGKLEVIVDLLKGKENAEYLLTQYAIEGYLSEKDVKFIKAKLRELSINREENVSSTEEGVEPGDE